jgi:pimeloyl-ACP methyl ester carboxylesterase
MRLESSQWSALTGRERQLRTVPAGKLAAPRGEIEVERGHAATLRRLMALFGALAVVLGVTGTASAAPPQPFGHACTPQNGVRFCPTVDSAHRVPSFDGVPLDVDVTLPATGQGPFPTIVMLHGWGGDKTSFESNSPTGHYNNNYYARQGYAVVNSTARGWGNSCGGGPSGDHSGPCGQGYIRLADTRYEARDTQHLLGLLADEGIAKPTDIGVTGVSYGGGQSTELAFLRDKIRKPGGTLAPWRSPDGARMSIGAAYPRWPWSDLVDALLPNGRFLDTQVAPFKQSVNVVGVPIQSYVTGLYALGLIGGYYCGSAPASTPCNNPQADITQSYAFINAGQPLSAQARAALESVYLHNDAYSLAFLEGHSRPAPLLIQSGWTDDLFPPSQALRVYNLVRARYGNRFPVNLQFGDLGHSRGSNKPSTTQYFTDQASRFFAERLKGGQHAPAPGSVTAFTQTCPSAKPDGGPFTGKSWPGIQRGPLTFGDPSPQTFTSAGGDPSVAQAFDPISGTSDACKTIAQTSESNVAVYDHVLSSGVTMLGLPTVRATIEATGQFGQIDARLWDISPDNTQRLVTRGVYSLKASQSGKIAFQLHGNGYRFGAGHVIQLQLLGRDAPYYQAGNLPVSVDVSDLKVSIPLLNSSH